MIVWWNSLQLAQQISACIAIPATLILVIQTILLLIGLGDGGDDGTDADGDFDDADADGLDDGLTLFSVRGIMSMLAVMGWSSFALLDTSLPPVVSIIISLIAGIAMLFIMAYIMKFIASLHTSGNIDIGNAIGKVAQVYIPIPPMGTGSGKVNITVQEQLCEMGAITTSKEKLKTGTYVRVTATSETGMLVVEPISTENN